MTPTLIAQVSDPHIRLDDAVSQDALAAAVARVLTLNPLPAAVLVTGDIANSGDPAEHERALELLAPLPMPVHRLAGNHDLFPAARFHVQESEMVFATGPCMCHEGMRHPFEEDDVVGVAGWGLNLAAHQQDILMRHQQRAIVRNGRPATAIHQRVVQRRAFRSTLCD